MQKLEQKFTVQVKNELNEFKKRQKWIKALKFLKFQDFDSKIRCQIY